VSEDGCELGELGVESESAIRGEGMVVGFSFPRLRVGHWWSPLVVVVVVVDLARG
jgi:hypothetical protein